MGAAQLCLFRRRFALLVFVLAVLGAIIAPAQTDTPPAVRQHQRFLAARSLSRRAAKPPLTRSRAQYLRPQPQSSPAGAWQPLGPTAVQSTSFGLVTGRISSLAFDPSDTTGNTVYVGATGGGVWKSQNAATSNPSNIVFTPLTDNLAVLANTADATISIGALTVQPGGTGVILAGTGDPNDSLDSYYGAGILRSTDDGNTWTLIRHTTLNDGAGNFFGFLGEGFAGFAWSTVNPQVVVAAVSQAYEGQLVDAGQSNYSYTGLYYSKDGGASWNLARITDGNGSDVQGPTDALVADGNPATAVVWNPVRNVFIAAVRFHGYYQSSDGVTWTRLANQPGPGLSTALCPTNSDSTGSPACPILRGALAVNPLTGDTFAWTVDLNNQDQGLRQDVCAPSGGVCTNQTIAFSKQLATTALEADTWLGAATIPNGDYNLVLAAVPSSQDTLLFAGANDLWKCSLAMGCAWRNTTNSTSCMSAKVGEYHHALAWNLANPLEIFDGNDSGLWRSEDAIAETASVCDPSDAMHFQNLNGALGSLAEVESMSQVGASPYTMMASLGANGTAGLKGAAGPTSQWPEILGGEGGPVAIDSTNANNWYVNNGAGVSIHRCSQAAACTAADFGAQPVISNLNVSNDGLTMTAPAPFLVDPADPSQLLIGTCRVWRGPANGNGWTSANAISPILDGTSGLSACSGNALIRSLAALPLVGGGEIVYVGMYGSLNGGGRLAGHVLTATMNAGGAWSSWRDLTFDPVANNAISFNLYGLDIGSLYVDPHDATGNTVYVTVAGIPDAVKEIGMAYRSTDGGAHWTVIGSNLPFAPANSIVVDPVDANTVYLASDLGVFATRQIASCGTANCWAAYGAGLPLSPVVQLSASPPSGAPNVLVAATYGRGVWQIPLMTAGTQVTTATVSPTSLTFAAQPVGQASNAQTVTLTNTGGIGLAPTLITATTNFAETDNCLNSTIDAGQSCSIHVTFTPQSTGALTGQLTITANLSGGSLVVPLSGTGNPPNAVQLTPAAIDFGKVETGKTSAPLQVSMQNAGAGAVNIASVTATGPFVVASNVCGSSLAANTSCQLTLEFQPTATGSAAGTLTVIDDAGTQTVQLTGTGTAPPTDTLAPSSLTFPGTIVGTNSAAQTVTLTNSGGNPLTSIAISVTGTLDPNPFQQSNNCTTQLTGGLSCSINVTFTPTAQGTQTGTLVVGDILRAQAQTVALSGIGLLPPAFSVTPASLSFSGQQVGAASAPAALTIKNSGGAPMSNVGFQIAGPSMSSFSVSANTCGATLANDGSSCTMQVVFTPSAAGAQSANLTLSSSTLGVKPLTVSLTGTGQAVGALSVKPAQLNFTAQAIGQPSAPQTVTIANNGAAAAADLALAATSPFSLSQNTCGSSLAAGASCSAGVEFTPMQSGSLSGTLTIASSTVTPPVTVALNGIGGLTGAVQVQPAQANFPITGDGATSSAVTLTISNTATAIALSNLVLTASSGFQIASTTCGSQLTAGASCTASIAFSPTAAGNVTGQLTIASSSLAAAVTVPLAGTGFDFTIANSGSLTQTVASGSTATYALTLSPNGGGATFTFQCNSLPADAGCTFNPTANTVAAAATGTEAIQIATSKASAQLSWPHAVRNIAGIALAFGVLLLPLARRYRRFFLVAIAAVAFLCIASCASSGGGGGSTPPSSGGGASKTPAGTYAIPVIVSANGEQHSVTLTLVVD